MKLIKKNNMKRYLFIFALLLGALSSWAQSASDQTGILQKCLDLPALQEYFPVNADGSHHQVYIMQYPNVFPEGIQVSKFGKPVQFTDRSVIANNKAAAYFLFHTFLVNGNTANVTFDFYYNYSTNKTMLQGTIVLKKTDGNWIISDSKLIGR